MHSIEADVRSAAAKVIAHQDQLHEPIWRRLFDVPMEPHLLDQTREFAAALNRLFDLSPSDLGRVDLREISQDIEDVIRRLERRIEALHEPKDAMPFVAAIYVLRQRFETLSLKRADRAAPEPSSRG